MNENIPQNRQFVPEKASNGRWITGAIVVIILLIIGVIAWRLMSGDATETVLTDSERPATDEATTTIDVSVSSEPEPTLPKTTSITLSDTGFSPTTITISKDDTVTFVNQSKGRMWIASDPHPDHSDYPAFDEDKAAGAGASWSFTFTVPGRWGFHNHLNPTQRGMIIVEGIGDK